MSPEQSLSHLQTYCIRKCGRGQFQRLILDTNFSAVQSFILEEIRRDLNYRQPGSKRGCGQCFFLHNSQVMLRLRSGYSQVILRLFSGYSQLFFGCQNRHRQRRKLFQGGFLSFFCIFMLTLLKTISFLLFADLTPMTT